MAINWKLRATVFQLLAAVYAEMGEEAFKGRYMSIAKYFGPDATYDAIKSFFAKEVSKAADQLKVKAPAHRGSRRGIPPRASAGPSSRPPLLYFDDEDISIVTQREAEVHVNHSLRAPAKRARVITASPTASPVPMEAIQSHTLSVGPQPPAVPIADSDPSVQSISAPPAEIQTPFEQPSNPEANSSRARQTRQSHPIQEDTMRGKKRARSALDEGVAPANHHDLTSSVSSLSVEAPESFAYVTDHGQYRCALCLSQLPTREDLDRHEKLSKEHLRNLQSSFKISRGREKLAKVTAPPPTGPHASTPAPAQPLRLNGVEEGQRHQVNENGSLDEPSLNERLVEPSNRHKQPRLEHESPLDTIELRQRSVSHIPNISGRTANVETASTPDIEIQDVQDKGKGRATSLAAMPGPATTSTPTPGPGQGGARLQTPSESAATARSRPTTAQTEIGTIVTPRAAQAPTSDGGAAVQGPFSAGDLAEIMRSTEMVIQLMGCVQREAATVATTYAGGAPSAKLAHSDSGIGGAESTGTTSPDVVPMANGLASAHLAGTLRPGVEVRAVKREQAGNRRQRTAKTTAAAKRKDTGEEVFFIVLD